MNYSFLQTIISATSGHTAKTPIGAKRSSLRTMIAPIKSRIPVVGDGSIYHLQITLAEVKPPIWRRLQVPGEANLGWLHAVIQVAMGWTNSHLHQFTYGGTVYSDPGFNLDEFGRPEDPRGAISKVRFNSTKPVCAGCPGSMTALFVCGLAFDSPNYIVRNPLSRNPFGGPLLRAKQTFRGASASFEQKLTITARQPLLRRFRIFSSLERITDCLVNDRQH